MWCEVYMQHFFSLYIDNVEQSTTTQQTTDTSVLFLSHAHTQEEVISCPRHWGSTTLVCWPHETRSKKVMHFLFSLLWLQTMTLPYKLLVLWTFHTEFYPPFMLMMWGIISCSVITIILSTSTGYIQGIHLMWVLALPKCQCSPV